MKVCFDGWWKKAGENMEASEKIYELVKAMPEEEVSKVLTFVESLQQKTKGRLEQSTMPKDTTQSGRFLSDYAGLLKDSPNFNEDPVELQRRIRDEWS